MENFMNTSIFTDFISANNTGNYLNTIAVLLLCIAAIFIIRAVLKKQVASINDDKADIRTLIEKTTLRIASPVLYASTIYLSIRQLVLPENIFELLSYAITVILTIQGILDLLSLPQYPRQRERIQPPFNLDFRELYCHRPEKQRVIFPGPLFPQSLLSGQVRDNRRHRPGVDEYRFVIRQGWKYHRGKLRKITRSR